MILIILITASFADARPEGTVIKDGVLTYPAGPYLTEDPLLLSLESYEDDSNTQPSGDSLKTVFLEKDCMFLDNNNEDIIPWIPGAENLLICPSTLFSIYYGCK